MIKIIAVTMGSFSNNPPNVKALFWIEDFKKCSTIDLMQCKDTHNNVASVCFIDHVLRT